MIMKEQRRELLIGDRRESRIRGLAETASMKAAARMVETNPLRAKPFNLSKSKNPTKSKADHNSGAFSTEDKMVDNI